MGGVAWGGCGEERFPGILNSSGGGLRPPGSPLVPGLPARGTGEIQMFLENNSPSEGPGGAAFRRFFSKTFGIPPPPGAGAGSGGSEGAAGGGSPRLHSKFLENFPPRARGWAGWAGGWAGSAIYIYTTMFDTRSLSLLAKLVLQSEHHIQIMWACIMAHRLSALRDIHTSGVISEAGNTINLGLTSLITIL